MRALLLLVAAAIAAGVSAVTLDAAPVPKDFGETVEAFTWKGGKGAKRTRTVRTLVLGGESVPFVKVPKGRFLMGSPDDDMDASADEKPAHTVTFTKPLWVGQYPVTKGQFAAFVKATKYQTEAEKDGKGSYGFDGKEFEQAAKYSWRATGWEQSDTHPVVNVTWNDAVAYCDWASRESKQAVRLPTEAQYEYANRGGETTRYFTGEDGESLDGYANVADASAKATWGCGYGAAFDDGSAFTSPVGKYKPNGFGLHDTTGNVWCWCADGYDGKAYAGRKDGVTDPKPHGDGERTHRVLRGGSWNLDPRFCRAACRIRRVPDYRYLDFGFRVVFCLD